MLALHAERAARLRALLCPSTTAMPHGKRRSPSSDVTLQRTKFAKSSAHAETVASPSHALARDAGSAHTAASPGQRVVWSSAEKPMARRILPTPLPKVPRPVQTLSDEECDGCAFVEMSCYATARTIVYHKRCAYANKNQCKWECRMVVPRHLTAGGTFSVCGPEIFFVRRAVLFTTAMTSYLLRLHRLLLIQITRWHQQLGHQKPGR